jgi:hypothetical protein
MDPLSDLHAGEPIESPHLAFQGRVIRRIRILQLPVLGNPAGDDRVDGIIALGNRLHIDTRQRTIRNYMLIREGDRIDPHALADTEHILRATRFIHDASIEVLTIPGVADSVDVLVALRDRWSIGVGGSISNTERYRVNIFDRNFLGFGHTLDYGIDVDKTRSQTHGQLITLQVDNVGGTFLDTDLSHIDSFREATTGLALTRSEVAPQIAWTGGLILRSMLLRADAEESPTFERQSVDVRDAWLGRGVSIGMNPAGGPGRTRLTLAGRVTYSDYHERPMVGTELNRGFHDRTLVLASLSLHRNDYRRDRLILGYGRTEDIPHGYVLGLTGGYDFGEFENRAYAGAELRMGRWYERSGNVSAGIRLGGFMSEGKLEDGAFGLTLAYFTRLLALRSHRLRVFAAGDYIQGIGREPQDQIELGQSNGIPGQPGLIESRERGTHRVSFSLEPVLFMPWTALGFRPAFFVFGAVGAVGSGVENLFTSVRYSSAFGAGISLHNERLVFDAFEFRLSVLPAASGLDVDWFNFSTVPELSLPEYVPGAPAVLPYN